MTVCGFEWLLLSCLEFMLRQVLPLQSITYLSMLIHNLSTDYLHNMYLRFYYKAVKARSCSLKSRSAGSNLWPGWAGTNL